MDQQDHWDKLREITSRTLEMTEYVIREVSSIRGAERKPLSFHLVKGKTGPTPGLAAAKVRPPPTA
jgi:hypothetical protein